MKEDEAISIIHRSLLEMSEKQLIKLAKYALKLLNDKESKKKFKSIEYRRTGPGVGMIL